ncbi:hypothetical protein D3C85_1153450 [compost metagenome]
MRSAWRVGIHYKCFCRIRIKNSRKKFQVPIRPKELFGQSNLIRMVNFQDAVRFLIICQKINNAIRRSGINFSCRTFAINDTCFKKSFNDTFNIGMIQHGLFPLDRIMIWNVKFYYFTPINHMLDLKRIQGKVFL